MRTNTNSRLAILVTSCDSYSDVWDPFFKLMDSFWPDIKYPVYLNTETVQYKNGHNFSHFEVTTLNLLHPKKKSRWSWSQRMLDVLDRVKEEYVLILVEDFFLREKVQTEIIEDLLDKMDKDNMIGQIQLFGTRINCDNEKMNDMNSPIDLQQIGDDKAKVVFVPTIWRKSVLKKWLRKWETIWAFESYASKRAKRWHYKEKVYRLYSPAVFNYLWEKECYCVVNGKWMVHPLLIDLFNSNGINVDFSQRGTITMEEWSQVSIKTIIKRLTFAEFCKKVIYRILSIF